jgi:tripartite-type tricarboxylate transporter receptor subunit TctC
MKVLASLATLLALSGTAFAQDWPARPVTMIVPYAAGGPVDTVGRIMAQGLSEALGQQVIIENIGGAGGMTGANRVAKAAPDGYTLLLGGSATMTTVPALYGKKALYNPLTDFEHVIQFADSARILIARKDFPANSLKEFVAYARANVDKLQYGSSGTGAGAHICALLLDQAMGVKITHVPYRGSGPAMQDLLGGRIDYICEQVSTAVQQIKAGTVKPIATMGLSRSDVLPDLKTGGGRRLRSQLRVAQRVRISQGHARRDREAPGRGDQQGGRKRLRARALRCARCRGRAGRAAYARVLSEKPAARSRAAGAGDEGERADGGLSAAARG